VHIYVGVKAVIAEADAEQAKKLRGQLIALLSRIRSAPASAPATSQPSTKISAKKLATLAKRLWKVKKRGAELVRSEKDPPPILPVLLPGVGLAKLDANDEHALLALIFVLAKAHPKMPLPLPPELMLYEASRARPEKLSLPGAKAGLHAIRAWVFSQHGLCDFAGEEERAFSKSAKGAELDQLITLLPEKLRKLPTGSGKYLAGALSALAAGGTAKCYLSRGDEAKAREKIVQMLDAADKLGIKIAEGELLRAYVECRGDKKNAEKGLARLAALPARFKGLSKRTQETSTALAEYCRTAAGTESSVLRKISLVRISLALARAQAERAGATQAIEQTEVYAAGRRLAELLQRATGGSDTLKDKLKKGKGWLNTLRGKENKPEEKPE